MTAEAVQQLWDSYERGWSDVTGEERDRLLRGSLAEDCYSANPLADGRGRELLQVGMEEYQKHFPGASIKTHTLRSHHGQLLALWVGYNGQGEAILKGGTTARFNEEGQLTELAGFWPV